MSRFGGTATRNCALRSAGLRVGRRRQRPRLIVTSGCSYEGLPQPSGGPTLASELLTHGLAERLVAELERIDCSPTDPASFKVTQFAI